MKVFVSHASGDKPLVRKIADSLRTSGVEVWLDEADVRVGESIPEAVSRGLDTSDLLLFAFSKRAFDSPWVKRELHAFFVIAMSSGKPIIPCRLDDSTPPVLLADIKYADFKDDFNAGMNALLGAVGIAEEIAISGSAADLAMSLETELTADERKRCYGTWVKRDKLGISLMDQAIGAVPTGTLRVIELLGRHGLIEEVGQAGDHDITWIATALGKRVFAHWAPGP